MHPSAPPTGLTVNGYELRARLGEGGMGVVHLAQRPGGRPVALKVLRPNVVGDDEARHRLAREVDSLARVRNRRVAEVIDADPWGTVPYVATRYVPGLTLHDHAQQEGPVTGDDLVWLADCLAEALQAVHAVGVLHRDIKPSNVILEGRTPILIDFGLARVADDSRITMTGWLLGTPGYLAPEILHGHDATEASDVHSWAATVAFAAQGRAPYGRGPSMAVMDRVRRGEHDLDDVDDVVHDLLESCLDPEPDQRPDLAEVRSWLADLGSSRGRREVRRAQREAPLLTAPYVAAEAARAQAVTEVERPVPDEAAEGTVRQLPPTRHLPEPAPEPQRGWERTRQVEPAPWSGEAESWDDEPREWDEAYADDEGGGAAWSEWTEVGAPARPAGLFERMRRGTLSLLLGLVGAAAVAAAPWLAVAVLVVLAWILRAGSLSTEAMERRRSVRGGARWWDGVLGTLAAPWHLVAALPGAGLLVLWACGAAVAAALLCYALSVPMAAALGVMGLCFVGGLWWGPGGSRLRGPVHRGVDAAAARPVAWLLVAVLVAACASGLAAYAEQAGPNWAPGRGAPFAEVSTPSWL